VGNLDSIKFTVLPPQIDATKFSTQKGVSKAAGYIGALAQGDWVGYKGLDLGAGVTQLKVLLAAPRGWSGQTIEVRTGSPTGEVIGRVVVRRTPGWTEFRWQSIAITRTAGVKDIYLTFAGTGWVGNVRAFRFA
jgi:hypothetical protein